MRIVIIINGRNIIQAIKSCAIPVIGYAAGIISWTQNEVAELDRKTRKALNTHGGLHPRADINRLYSPGNKGGWALRQVKYTILIEQMTILEYINNKLLAEPLLNAVWQSNMLQVSELDNESWKKKW